ncbi:MAG: hypothetical protein ACRCY8_06065 [Dermatophilaceae bacterium]
MKIYVAGPMSDVGAVRAVHRAVVLAGHELTLDWSRGPDSTIMNYALSQAVSARIAVQDLAAVLAADAVLVVAGDDGRGMFVELGAALARADRGDLRHIVVIGPITHDSVFYHHPAVQRVSDVAEWLAGLDPSEVDRRPEHR